MNRLVKKALVKKAYSLLTKKAQLGSIEFLNDKPWLWDPDNPLGASATAVAPYASAVAELADEARYDFNYARDMQNESIPGALRFALQRIPQNIKPVFGKIPPIQGMYESLRYIRDNYPDLKSFEDAATQQHAVGRDFPYSNPDFREHYSGYIQDLSPIDQHTNPSNPYMSYPGHPGRMMSPIDLQNQMRIYSPGLYNDMLPAAVPKSTGTEWPLSTRHQRSPRVQAREAKQMRIKKDREFIGPKQP